VPDKESSVSVMVGF